MKAEGLGDTIYTAVKKALSEPAGNGPHGGEHGLGDTIYSALRKALADTGNQGGQGSGGGGGDAIAGMASMAPWMVLASDGSALSPGSYFTARYLAVRADTGNNGTLASIGDIDTRTFPVDDLVLRIPSGLYTRFDITTHGAHIESAAIVECTPSGNSPSEFQVTASEPFTSYHASGGNLGDNVVFRQPEGLGRNPDTGVYRALVFLINGTK
jgi:hypothetical protein